jgi:lysophospholipase L1-like esterase
MRKRLISLICVAPVLWAVTVAAPAHAAAPVDYVALGDSYSSGVGAPPYTGGTCRRSARSYAQLWANSHTVTSFNFAACGGAVTSDVLNNQLGSLNANTDLVTITIGGNDVGFADTVFSCVLGGDTACVNAVNNGIDAANTTLPGRLDATYAAIRSRAPNATLVVLGYPHLVEPNGNCLSSAKRAALNRGADALHTVIAARAAAGGARYVDARGRFTGHGACGSAPWINRFSIFAIVESFHPNAAGYSQGYLPLVNSITG